MAALRRALTPSSVRQTHRVRAPTPSTSWNSSVSAFTSRTGAAAFVYPSFFEGFGLPVLEAMACGTPVVTYNTTSLPEVAGPAAILLDPPVTAEALAAALARATEDLATREALIGRGLEQVKRFDWRRTAALTQEVYESLIG